MSTALAFEQSKIITGGKPTVAVMTSGGDCAGLNAAIHAIVMTADKLGWNVIGIEEGTLGLLHNRTRLLRPADVEGWDTQPSTNLFSTREVYKGPDPSPQMIANFRALDCRALIVIGGDGSLEKVSTLARKGEIPLVALPKTIDFDIGITDQTIGHDTAIAKVVDTMHDLVGTARAHKRIMVVETMGRDRGWIALKAALEGKADAVIVPEFGYDIRKVANHLNSQLEDRRYALLVVSEGVMAPGGNQVFRTHGENTSSLGGIAKILVDHVNYWTGADVRDQVVGYTQRGGRPTEHDRLLASNMGAFGMNLVTQEIFGVMVASDNETFKAVPLDEVLQHKHIIGPEHKLIPKAHRLGIYIDTDIPAPTRSNTLKTPNFPVDEPSI